MKKGFKMRKERYKYSIEDVKKVENLMAKGLSKYKAIEKTGFSNASMFYLLLKRLGLAQVVTFKKKIPVRTTFI